MAATSDGAWLPADEADLLRRTFRRLLNREGIEAALAVVDDYRGRRPDHPMVAWIAAWGPTVARDWTAAMAPPTFDPAAESAPVDAGQLDVVVWFVADPSRTMGDPANGPAPVAKKYLALIGACFATARRAAPAVRTVLLTDPHTAVPDDIGADAIVRAAVPPGAAMHARMRAYRDHLAAAEGRAGAVFLDPDIVVCRSPAAAFAEPFSLGLTWRRNFPAMPVNGGVVFARRTPGAVWLLDRALDCYASIADDPVIGPAFARLNGTTLRAWYGDQVALAALADWRRFRGGAPQPCVFGPGATIGFLPEDPFNFAIERGMKVDAAAAARRVLVHFKGPGKAKAQALAAKLLRAEPVDGAGRER